MEINTTPKKKEILAKKGLVTMDDLAHFLPRKYSDYTKTFRQIDMDIVGSTGCFVGVLQRLDKKQTTSKCSIVSFRLYFDENTYARVSLFGQAYRYQILKNKEHEYMVVCGRLEHSAQYGYSIEDVTDIAPVTALEKLSTIKTEYKKFSGISDEAMRTMIEEALACYKPTLHIDDDLAQKYKLHTLPDTKQALNILHHPISMDMEKANQRLVVDELLSFAVELEKQTSRYSKGTHIRIVYTKIVKEIISSLPYLLTADQEKCYFEMVNTLKEGKRVDALIQGDVGCGKTLIAILMLFLLAENGYQGCLMAPTSILAKQHYEEIKAYGDRFGIKVAYLDGDVKPSAKKNILSDIESGETSIIIGTHTLTCGLPFSNLGLVIIDEEHRFGANQRAILLDHAQYGVNTIMMSATPIPRTLAGSLHGNNTKIYDIRTMPANRKPIQTAINSSDNRIFDFIEKQLDEGRQAYVVCPLIEKDEETSPLMDNVLSATDCYEQYKLRFEPTYKIALLNGKMSDNEISETIQAFKRKEYHILVSTTVIEVGVNVPNASVIVISNAERFGLAAMHQLRGRVGRGDYKGYCILKSVQKDNDRLRTMVDCADGFSIAAQDLSLRGAGDLIGVKQSGNMKYMELILKYPNLYSVMQQLAKEVVERQ